MNEGRRKEVMRGEGGWKGESGEPAAGCFKFPAESSHLGTRETSFTRATGFTGRTFGTSRAGRTTFTSRTLSGEKSQTHQGHSLDLITMG